MRQMLMLAGAALLFVLGGVAMKMSESLTLWRPAVLVYLAFAAGATLQALAMRSMTMSIAYAIVLGLEAVLAVAFGAVILHERVSLTQVVGTACVVVGIIVLKSSE